MRLKGIWILGAIALAGLALATTGCGGGGGTTTVTVDSSTETTETTTTESTDTTTTEETTTEETDTTATETDSSGTDTTALGFATSENCQEFLTLANNISDALSGSGDTDLQQAADAMQKFADEAPEDIKDDFQTLADAYSKIADALDGVDLTPGSTPSPEAIAKLASLAGQIDSAKLAAASTNIATWTSQNCTGG